MAQHGLAFVKKFGHASHWLFWFVFWFVADPTGHGKQLGPPSAPRADPSAHGDAGVMLQVAVRFSAVLFWVAVA